jgi:energy-coupling factor transporter ATP-binding protein EcfA2
VSIVEYPVILVLGRRGAGKSNLMTAMAKIYADAGVRVIANFHLFGIRYVYMTFDEIVKAFHENPDALRDSVLMLDEIKAGGDAYKFYTNEVQMLASLFTQIRKLHSTIYFGAQVVTQAAKRLREQIDYVFELTNAGVKGVTVINKYEIIDGFEEYISSNLFDGRPYWHNYDTDELVYKDKSVSQKVEI